VIPGAGPIEIARIISIGPRPAGSCINRLRDYASARRGSVGYPPGGRRAKDLGPGSRT